MMQQWQHFLKTQGAVIEDGQVIEFESIDKEREAALSTDVIADFSHFAIIKVSGSEAQTFLQGQFTNDIRQVSTNKAQISAWCSAKGRMLVSFYICQRHDDYYLFLAKNTLATILKRLQMFVLRADVQLKDVSNELLCFGIAGENSHTLLENLQLAVPETVPFAATLRDGLSIINLPTGLQPRYFLIHDNFEVIKNLWTQLSIQESVQKVGRDAWELLDILAALPTVDLRLSDEFVPQMLNWQALGGLNFKKGCYTGQEVVARMKYLGNLKRRMYLATLDADQAPTIGEKLFVDAENAGQIVNVQVHPNGGYVLLIVLKINLENNLVYCESITDKSLKIQTLPYNLTE